MEEREWKKLSGEGVISEGCWLRAICMSVCFKARGSPMGVAVVIVALVM